MNLRDLNKAVRFSKLAEFRQVVTPRNKEHYRELMKHLHAMELDPVNRTDPELMGEIQRRRLELRNWAEKNIKREDDGGRAQQAYKLARDQKVDYANIMFHGKEIDHNSIEYEMQDFSDMIYELHGAKYIDGTPLTDEELEEFEKTGELIDWVAEDYASSGPDAPDDEPFEDGKENFSFGQIAKAKAYAKLYRDNYTTAVKNIEKIAKGLSSHPDVADALRKANEDDEPSLSDFTDPGTPEELAKEIYFRGFSAKQYQAQYKTWQEFMNSEDFEMEVDRLRSKFEDSKDDKKKASDELMKQFLAKGGKVQKVPTGQTAYKGKQLKPAFKKDPALKSTPITSPMSDESVKEDYPEARLLGAAQASLGHGLELADAVLKGDENMAKTKAEIIKQNWPELLDKIKNIYKPSAKEELDKILNFDKKDYGLKERMPASIIKHKQKLSFMSDKELADRFKDKDETTLRQMAWRHGYGKMSSHYWDRVQAGKQETTESVDHLGLPLKKEDSAVKEDAPFGTGMDLVRMAVMRKFISAEEYVNFAKELKAAGEEVANGPHYADWPDGEGFGSSDGNFAIRDLMSTAGYEFDDNDTSGRFVVTKMPEKLAKMGITNVRMKQPELPIKSKESLKEFSISPDKVPALKDWYKKYSKFQTYDQQDPLPDGMSAEYDSGVITDRMEENEVEKAIKLIGKDVEDFTDADWRKVRTVMPISNGMVNDLSRILDGALIGEEEVEAVMTAIHGKNEQDSDGMQPADLKRLGQSVPKIYVHKNGKTILIPKSKHNEFLAKGWKKSALRAE